MKEILLRERKLKSTACLTGDELGKNGHDLKKGIRALGAGASEVPAEMLGDFKRKHGDETVPVVQLHEVWRYGAQLSTEDAERAHLLMKKLIRYIDDRRRRV